MNEPRELERELAELRPLGISAGLSERIAARLDGPRLADARAPGLRLSWQRAGVLAAAAAVILAATLAQPTLHDHPAARADLPTSLAYRRAFVHSPESFDALLDRHAARLALSNAASPRAADSLTSLSSFSN
jgi:hypothetical protein